MSDLVYDTYKVWNKDNSKKLDKIDIFSERINPNNLFGIVYYTEFKKGKPITKSEIITFASYESMIEYLKNNFNTYELTHYVDPRLKHIFFHYADYCSVDYYLHDGKPNKNYVVFNYREYENGKFFPRSMSFPKECEGLLLQIVNRSKPQENKNKLVFANTIDVNAKRKQNALDNFQRYSIPISELIKFSGEKIKNIRYSPTTIKKLKILVAGTVLATIMASGYKLVTNNIFNSEYLEQNNRIRNTRDIGISLNKGKAGIIIEKLMQGDYSNVTSDELRFITEFIGVIDDSNYDQNDSFNVFDFDDYFEFELLHNDNYSEARDVLKNIEDLYKKSFNHTGNKVTVNKSGAKKYLDYVLSLTFMYDTYHQTRPFTTVNFDSQSDDRPYATSSEISTFDSYPPILRLIILNEAKGLLSHTDYDVTERPSYYFDGLDKYSLLSKINEEINNVKDTLYNNCGINFREKSK